MRRQPAFFIRELKHSKKWITLLLLLVNIFAQFSFLEFLIPRVAEAAQVIIDATVSTTATNHLHAGSQSVFISDLVGYKFYVDSTGVCAYSKTLDGGGTWATAVTVDSQVACVNIVVWYDRWTPGNYGKNIHISTMANNVLWYNRLDTSNDSLLLGSTTVNAISNSGQSATLASNVNETSITEGSDGKLYMATSAATNSFVVTCSTNCGVSSSWSLAGIQFLPHANDWNLLEPLAGGKILLINRSISSAVIQSRTWSGSAWSASWDTVDSNAITNTTYDVGMSAAVDPLSNDIYFVYSADNSNFTVQNHDIRTAKYSAGTWTKKTDVFTNNPTKGLTNVAIGLDTNTSNIYVAYSARTTPAVAASANIYYATSTSAMLKWSTEQGPLNTTPLDAYGIDLNVLSDQRLYATWEDPTTRSMFGNTLVDLVPTFYVSASGVATTTVNASSSNLYLGGQFVMQETVASRNVTDIVISETGTINGSNNLKNVKLFYDIDTTAPYDCASESYAGTEPQFGTTVTNGFSGANGVASFSDSVNVSPTRALCIYVVSDVLDNTIDGSTIKLSINNPSTGVLVSGGVTALPLSPADFATSTLVKNDNLRQVHYNWRNDNGSEITASSTMGTEDTAINALSKNSPKRLRIEVSNKGSITSLPTKFRLEYGTAAPTCAGITTWTDIASSTGMWNLYNSPNFLDGSNTTNIATTAGGVTDDNPTFLTPNGGLKNTSSQTSPLTLSTTNFVELEFAIQAATSSVEGNTYCFRVTDAGNPLPNYTVYPSATVSANVTVSASGTQSATFVVPSTNNYLGGMFVLKENTASRNITGITITQTGTVNASTSLNNIKLRYSLDTTAPYDCSSKSYTGTEPQFGSTNTTGFSGPNGSSTFSGSVSISTTQAMCVYVITDVKSSASNGQTIKISLARGGDDITASTGSVSPSTPININGTTTLAGSVVAQTNYHWRNDDGSEATSTSATGGIENTPMLNQSASTSIRLRIGISNTGTATSTANFYRLEFGIKISTCSAVNVWTGVGDANDDWNMFSSVNLTDGNNTTNIATSTGGISDTNTTFLTPNAGVRELTGTTSAITLSSSQFTEFEFSLTSTAITAFNTTYCFRLTTGALPLVQYNNYAEINTSAKRDFKIQTGNTTVTGTSTTLVAGVNYVAPASSSTAFVRITNLDNTGAGKNASGGAQNASDVTAYISNPTNILNNIIISRPTGAINNTRVSWEIVEFIGSAGTDNEMKVRSVGTLSLASASTSATSSVVSGVTNSSKVVVFVTGTVNRDVSRNFYYTGQFSSSWSSTTQKAVFNRGAGGALADLSYAVVEFTGINWAVQRVEHNYTATGTIETESITPVNSLARTFIHTQKRMTAQPNVNNFGHEVWLSSIGAVSFQLEAGATVPTGHTSVVWIVENQQTSSGAMSVQRSNGNTTGGGVPVSLVISMPVNNVSATNNTSISGNGRVVGANSTFPLAMAGLSITSTSTFTLWRSETAGVMTYRAEIIEWPVTGLAVRQDYYRIYVDNNSLTPTDPWPLGPVDLGENTPVTAVDSPPGGGENLRLRMTLKVSNATLPAGFINFKLQYGQRTTLSCTAVAAWNDVGAAGSGAIWRGFSATGTTNGVSLSGFPATAGDLLITKSQVAGSFIDDNPSPANPYSVAADNESEYDWLIQNNGALERTTYCFRMVKNDGTTLDGYFYYPQIKTSGFTPLTQNWRWYDDTNSETPTVAMASENVAPIEVLANNDIALRATVSESKNVIGIDIKYKLQYDESPTFSNPLDVTASSSCVASSTWCYGNGTSTDNVKITTKVLSDADVCIFSLGNGCGTHNNSPTYATGTNQAASAKTEYEFYLKNIAARSGAVYYFRLYEIGNDAAVSAEPTYTYPSLVTETARLAISISGLPAGTTTAGIVTTVSSTPSTIAFGTLLPNTDVFAAHRISVDTNATEGYRVLSYARSQLLNSYGTAINSISGTNGNPVSWAIGCTSTSTGCVGYHTSDAILSGTSTRFSPLDSYSGLETTPQEVMYSSIPSSDTNDIVYRVLIKALQPANNYSTEIVYLAVPTY